MNGMTITAITVSCEVADKTYGNGDTRYMSLSARVAEGDPGISLTDARETGLEMYLTAWTTMMQTRYTTKSMGGKEFQLAVATAKQRAIAIQQAAEAIRAMSPEETVEFISSLKKKETTPE
jgi:hypothetical protein